MFTGFIDHYGTILKLEPTSPGQRITIACGYSDLIAGESIAVNGACLSVTEFQAGEFCCAVSPETLAVTTAGQLKPGSVVNLERCLRANDRLHGHFVLGHVDQTCSLSAKQNLGDYVEYQFSGVTDASKRYLIPKGSIAINGVSLTLNATAADTFSVMLIPATLEKTNLYTLAVGDSVNVEYDYLAKIINHSAHSL